MFKKIKSIKDDFIQELNKEKLLEEQVQTQKLEIDELKRKYGVKCSQRDEIERLLKKYRDLHQIAENRSNEFKIALEEQKKDYEKQLSELQKANTNLSNQNKRLKSKLVKK